MNIGDGIITNQLRKLQLIQVEMLEVLSKICERHGIKIYLTGGTLLGAVRHKGFIPWDDDLDVMITRKDYEKLKVVLKKELPKEYYFQTIDDKNCAFLFSKIRKNNTLCVEKYASDVDMHQGIWIDIFIYDNAPDNNLLASWHFYRIKYYRYMLIVKVGFKLMSKNIFVKLVYGLAKLISHLYPEKFLKKKLNRLLNKYNNKETKRSFTYAAPNMFFVNNTDFDGSTKVLFEGKEYYAPKDYDDFLTRAYGDYMTPPPENKRSNVHILENVVFDTTKKSK